MSKRPSFARQCTVRIICALALLFVGFAHKPPAAGDYAVLPGAIAQYMLPDGTIPVLCLSSDGTIKHDPFKAGPGCEVCRLSGSVLLPAPAHMPGQPILRQAELSAPAYRQIFYRPAFCPSTPPRGPPTTLIT